MLRRIVAALLALAAPQGGAAEEGVCAVAADGVFMVGYRRDAPPMSDAVEGVPDAAEGYAVALCRRIHAALDARCPGKVALKYKGVEARNRFEALAGGDIDILCGTTSRTIARDAFVEFTLPTFITGGVFASRRGDRVRKVADLAGRRFGVIAGTTTDAALARALEGARVSAAGRREIAGLSAGLRRLALPEGHADRLDAVAGDQLTLLRLAASAGDVAVSTDFFSVEHYALALRPENRALRVLADGVLARLYRANAAGERPIEELFLDHFRDHFRDVSGWRGEIPEGVRLLFALNALPEGARDRR